MAESSIYRYSELAKCPEGTTYVGIVDRNIEDSDQLFKALARAFRFPDYFGHNWNALIDCLSDLAWLDEPNIMVVHQDLPLRSDPAEQSNYLEVLDICRARLSKRHRTLVAFFPDEAILPS
jgi:RNAse (barnase) inhibitor barstar